MSFGISEEEFAKAWKDVAGAMEHLEGASSGDLYLTVVAALKILNERGFVCRNCCYNIGVILIACIEGKVSK